MEAWIPAIGIIGLALVVGTTLVLSGPVGKALAQWIRGWSQTEAQWLAVQEAKRGGGRDELEQLRGAVETLTHRLGDVEERLDFAERLLARERPAARVAPPGAAS